MAASRKLQGEIDRCLKKVSEGVEQFEDVWKKVHNATNSNQKEKYEADLKKDIKKLQRLRDQIKSWLASGEIKDKTQLLENRKLIETQMERFKVVERETKTKAYSKEGLGAAQNKDPVQKEKEEMHRWLSDSIYNLNIQMDQFESEIESLLATGKKKKIDKEKSDRMDDLKDWLEKHRFHIKNLEILMRMLNNESIDCDKIKKIKEDVDYYVESSQEPGFMENDGLYDEIDLEDLDYPTPEITVGKSDGSPSMDGGSSHNTDAKTSDHVLGGQESTDGSTPSSSACGSSPAPSPAAPNSTNHSSEHDQNLHHERKRNSNKDDSRPQSTPVKPQVVRPSNSNLTNPSNSSSSSSNSLVNSNLTNKATPPPSTPTKPVSGSTSQSTPNNSSTSSGLTNHIIISPLQHNNLGSHSPESSLVGSGNVIGHNSLGSGGNSLLNSLSNHHSHSSNVPNHVPMTVVTNGPIGNSGSNGNNSGGSNSISNSSSSTSLGGGTVPGLLGANNGPIGPLGDLKSGSATPTSTANQLSNVPNMNSSDSTVSLKVIAQKKLIEVTSTLPLSASSEVSRSNTGSSITANSAATPPNTLAGSLSNSIMSSTTSTVLSNSNNSNNSTLINTSSNKVLNNSTNCVHLPPLLGVAPLGRVPLGCEHELQFKRTQMAFFHMPHPSDSERLRIHFPRQPCVTPSYYPQMPQPMSDTVDFFQRLSTETLFFIFYYMEGTKAQYLAAKALKKQSWRFHIKYMMWFQRHEEPKIITDEFEQGTYIFFDYEHWGQRKRENFKFEYRYLEDRDLN